ncbi:MAG: BrnA antitoxin family protein [Methylococcaceae bacterium]
MNANKNFMDTDWIDEDDAPELTDAFFEQADEYNNGVLIKRGFSSKEIVNLDSDIIAIFKATGENWQAKMNEVLREWVKSHPNLVAP